MKNMVLLIDTNIILDVLQNRSEHYNHSKQVLDTCKEKNVQGYLAAHSITNLWYILKKTHSDEQRRSLIKALLTYFDVVSLDKTKIQSALDKNDFKDFEDCLQDECASEIQADCIVTRNARDFSNSKIPVRSPEEFCRKCKY